MLPGHMNTIVPFGSQTAPPSNLVAYRDLPELQAGSIRLLTVRAGAFQDPFDCSLSTVKLDEAGTYVALSYSWGGGAHHVPLAITGCLPRFRITTKLYSSLKRLRDPHRGVAVWVDAICINQQDIVERADQVKSMQRIFSLATTVFIYLGEVLMHDLDAIHGPNSIEAWFPKLQILMTQPAAGLWWNRVWVLQELVSARNAVVCIGTSRAPWGAFLGGVNDKIRDIPLEVRHQTLKDRSSLAQRRLDDVKRQHGTGSQAIICTKCGTLLDTHSPNLLELIEATCICYATDPRDKIFALLGLVRSPHPQGVSIDYNIPSHVVFAYTTLHLLGTYIRFAHEYWRWPRLPHQQNGTSGPAGSSWIVDLAKTRTPTSGSFALAASAESVGASTSDRSTIMRRSLSQ